MELSLRMKQVADMVEPCHTVADIGCDHGYVSIYLIEQKVAQQVIAMDVRTGPLSRAKENVRQKQLQDRIQCRLSDGLEGLTIGEADTIVIAGMGGSLMISILEQGKKKRLGTETLVLQPQSDIPEVRRYLHRTGYCIVQEQMLWEEGKYYTILKAKVQETDQWDAVEYKYGKWLLEQMSPILYQYLIKEQCQLTELTMKLQQQQTDKARKRFEELKVQLEWNQEAQKRYEIKNNHELA